METNEQNGQSPVVWSRVSLMAHLGIADNAAAKVGTAFKAFFSSPEGGSLKGKILGQTVRDTLKTDEVQAYFARKYSECLREGWTPDYAESKPGKISGTSDRRTFSFVRPKEQGSIDYSGQERLRKMFGENSQVYKDIVAAGLFKKPRKATDIQATVVTEQPQLPAPAEALAEATA
jgi:hypothetical protein